MYLAWVKWTMVLSVTWRVIKGYDFNHFIFSCSFFSSYLFIYSLFYIIQALNGVLSYPLFFTLRNTFQGGQSLYNLQTTLQQYQSAFSDLDLLGTFIGISLPLLPYSPSPSCSSRPLPSLTKNYLDNHDQPRFLNGNHDYKCYQNAITYVLMGRVFSLPPFPRLSPFSLLFTIFY